MKLYKRTDGRSSFWQYDLAINGTRRRISTKTTDRKKALDIMREAIRAIPGQGGPVSIERALSDYVAHLTAQGKASASEAAKMRDKILGTGTFAAAGRFRISARLDLHTIKEPLLMQLKAARRDEGNGPQTIAHELKMLRAASFHARSNGHAMPTIKWRVPIPRAKTRWLTVEDWNAIYDEMDPDRPVGVGRLPNDGTRRAPLILPRRTLRTERLQARDLLVALTLCGGRWGEVTRLTVDQIMANGSIRLYGYKTGRERIVPCPARMAEAMARRKAAAEQAGSVYLFPSANGSGHQTNSGAIKRAFERAGVNAPHLVARDGKATIHSLRHSFASWLLQSGSTLSEVQDLLGHSSILMTQRYAHMANGAAVIKATGTLNGMFGPEAPPEGDHGVHVVAAAVGSAEVVSLDAARAAHRMGTLNNS